MGRNHIPRIFHCVLGLISTILFYDVCSSDFQKKLVLKIEIQIQRAEKNSPLHQDECFHRIFFFFFLHSDLFENVLLSTCGGEKNTPTNSLEELCNELCTVPWGFR